MRNREWKGSVFKPADKPNLYIRVKCGGVWQKRPTPFHTGPEDDNEKQTGPAWQSARDLLEEMRSKLLAEESAMGGTTGPLTVRAWSKKWLETRRGTAKRDDASVLNNHLGDRCGHAGPVLGDMLLSDVENRHCLDLVESWQTFDADGNLTEESRSNRTVGNWCSTFNIMFRDAAQRGLIKTSPWNLKGHLPKREDRDNEWRIGASFTRDEIEKLISPTPVVEADSRIVYGLLGLGAFRHGEMAALRWRHLLDDRTPLTGMHVTNSNAKRRTKMSKERIMPVHPVLRAMLAEWKLKGWEEFVGRKPTTDDFIVPLKTAVHGRKPKKGIESGREDVRRRTAHHSDKRLARHLRELNWRPRRVHDLRRTFIVLATADGADDRILEWGTHGRPGDIMGAYGQVDWTRLCDEVSKLKVSRASAKVGKVVPIKGRRGSGTK